MNKIRSGVAWGSLLRQMFFYRNIFGMTAAWKSGLKGLAYLSGIPGSGGPVTVNFLITDECNLSCSICSYQNKRNARGARLSLAQVKGFIAACAKNKPILFFSGGEPFIRGDMLEILAEAAKCGLKCGINTNGLFPEDQVISGLAGLGVDLVVFSLYGPEQIHDRITGVNGSFARSVVNIRRFCREKRGHTRVIVSCAINRYNVDHLNVIPLIARETGADAVKFEHLNFLSGGEARGLKPGEGRVNTLIADANDFSGDFTARLIRVLEAVKKEHKGFVMVKPDLSPEEITEWYGVPFNTSRRCFFPWHSVFIKPDGTVIPCQFLQDYPLGNILEDPLEDIFNNPMMRQLRGRLRSGLLPECSRCCKL